MLQSWLREAARIRLRIKLPAMAVVVEISESTPELSIAAASSAVGICRGMKDVKVEFLLIDKPSASVYFSTLMTILSFSGY